MRSTAQRQPHPSGKLGDCVAGEGCVCVLGAVGQREGVVGGVLGFETFRDRQWLRPIVSSRMMELVLLINCQIRLLPVSFCTRRLRKRVLMSPKTTVLVVAVFYPLHCLHSQMSLAIGLGLGETFWYLGTSVLRPAKPKDRRCSVSLIGSIHE